MEKENIYLEYQVLGPGKGKYFFLTLIPSS